MVQMSVYFYISTSALSIAFFINLLESVPLPCNVPSSTHLWCFGTRKPSSVKWLSPFLSNTSRALASALYPHKRATVLHNAVLYFGRLINGGSVSVGISAPCFVCERSSWRSARRTMGDLIGGHITLDHMYRRMQEHDPARANVVWPLLIVNCLITSLTLTCYRDQRFVKVHHETLL